MPIISKGNLFSVDHLKNPYLLFCDPQVLSLTLGTIDLNQCFSTMVLEKHHPARFSRFPAPARLIQ